MLFVVSVLFYAFGEPSYVVLILFSILLNYGIGRLIGREKHPKAWLTVGVVVNLGLLVFFKYFAFLMENLGILFPAITAWEIPKITLPIGISFYTFQALSYLVDVYRKEVQVQKHFASFGMYITFFPQLIAGPIVRYIDIEEQLNTLKRSFPQIKSGVELFTIGLGKKVLLSNAFGLFFQTFQSTPQANGTLCNWAAILAYTLHIYFDFSGYSDMAIGLGRMFGFEFLQNFNYPYISKSITDFWRRWHISLSTWFLEYLYIPLGGNRKGKARQVVNLFIVWLMTGLWHGASWNFLLWGGYYALLLVIEKNFLGKYMAKLPAFVQWACTFFAVMMGWTVFAFVDFNALTAFIKGLFTLAPLSKTAMSFVGYAPLFLVGFLFALPIGKMVKRPLPKWVEALKPFAFIAILWLSISALVSQSYNPFIYFRF